MRLTRKHIHALHASKFKKIWLFNFGDDILISTLTTSVESNTIRKLKHYMHNGLSIYQTKYCKTTFLGLARPILHNIQSSSSGQNDIIMSEIATNPLLSIKRNPFPTKNQTLKILQSIYFADKVGIINSYSNRIRKPIIITELQLNL